MATPKKTRGYAFIPQSASERPRLVVTSGDRLPRTRVIWPATPHDLTNREGRLFAKAVAGLAPGVYRATFQPARIGQAPSVKVSPKPVKLADEIAALDKQAKVFAEARTKRQRMLPQQAENLRLTGLRSRALADALRADLGRGATAPATLGEAIRQEVRGAVEAVAARSGFPIYRSSPDGVPALLATAKNVREVPRLLKEHGLEATIGRVYALDVANGLKLTLAPEVR